MGEKISDDNVQRSKKLEMYHPDYKGNETKQRRARKNREQSREEELGKEEVILCKYMWMQMPVRW